MKLLPWILVALLGVLLLILAGKVYTLRKSAQQLREGMAQQLERETNTLLSVSSGDREMRALADTLNGQLAQLRAERQRYQHGDLELKEAITNISHDLRTPLTAISGAASVLLSSEEIASSERSASLVRDIKSDADSLSAMVENLLSITKIRDGVMPLNKQEEMLEEVAGDALLIRAHKDTVVVLGIFV